MHPGSILGPPGSIFSGFFCFLPAEGGLPNGKSSNNNNKQNCSLGWAREGWERDLLGWDREEGDQEWQADFLGPAAGLRGTALGVEGLSFSVWDAGACGSSSFRQLRIFQGRQPARVGRLWDRSFDLLGEVLGVVGLSLSMQPRA